jgi:transcription elongation factor GreA-like protein
MSTEMKNALVRGLKNGLFATPEDPMDSVNKAYQYIEQIPSEHRMLAFTALHMCLNGVAELVDGLEVEDNEEILKEALGILIRGTVKRDSYKVKDWEKRLVRLLSKDVDIIIPNKLK